MSLLKKRRRASYGSIDSNDGDTQIQMADSTESGRHKSRQSQHKKGGMQDIKSCGDFCKWLRKDPLSRLGFLYFFISIPVPLIIAIYYFVFNEKANSYIIAGIYGICTCLYGFNHFRILFSLKKEVTNYQNLNMDFRDERRILDHEIDGLGRGRQALQTAHVQLQENNLKMCDMIKKFENLEAQLSAVNATNYDEITNIGSKAKHLKGKYYDIQLQQQRNMFWKIFTRLERKNRLGITEEDYEIFHGLLPKEHQERFNRLGGWQTLVKVTEDPHKDYIDSQDFAKALDVYAQMMVENVDITFKISRVETMVSTTGKDTDKQPTVTRKVTVLERKRMSGFYFTKEDIWKAAGDTDEESKSRSPTPLTEEPMLMHMHGIH